MVNKENLPEEEVYARNKFVEEALPAVMAGTQDDDVRQEVCLRLMNNYKNFRGDCELEIYVRTCIKSVKADFYRKRSRELAKQRGFKALGYDPSTDGLNRVDLEEEVEFLMRDLTGEQKELLHLKFWDGLTEDAIGKIMGVCYNTINVRKTNIFKTLRHNLERRGMHLGDLLKVS